MRATIIVERLVKTAPSAGESKIPTGASTPAAKGEVPCTTDAATDTLEHHRRLHGDGLRHIRPTIRPDAVVAIASPAWTERIAALAEASGIDVSDYASYICDHNAVLFARFGPDAGADIPVATGTSAPTDWPEMTYVAR